MIILKIDIDHKNLKATRAFFNFRLRYCKRYFPIWFTGYRTKWLATRKGYHVYVYLRDVHGVTPMDDRDINFFQSILMSDWLRELRNRKRISAGDKVWNLLFSTKIKNGKVQHERKLRS